ncbi:helix-turn-helix domain-containing protein [Mucilaginibacter ginsenosidivorans]|uniref:Helix-turn-helix transcriptional regulator n=1 Tax=Mucilaginibacter ginsenosidivorans TaxID=398053 RepID=A0A5B8UT12_9SPHI|nr:AraC family transcriptional regulator [Mucilaginibacter ginsenosidivorans]QEC61586.1 helix-turn-helix transcriptional regulator [Mucilaginibacter ginsenosidivorans]
MVNPNEILPGVIFYSYLSSERKDKVCFWNHHTFVLMVSGQLNLVTARQTLVVNAGELLLVGRNQLGTLTKKPLDCGSYESIVISLQEPLLRQIALEEHLDAGHPYDGPPNIPIPSNEYLQGYFQSILPYTRSAAGTLNEQMGLLKVKEGVKLLLHTLPGLRDFLFNFAAPHKIDLERFMLANYHFNLPLEEFARMTGRSLAAFKRDFRQLFGMPPRRWLKEKRLTEAHRLIGQQQRPSAIYLDLGFESLAHFSRAFKQKFGKAPSLVV